MKNRVISLALCLALLLSIGATLSACGKGKATAVPNVMGISHEGAKAVLEKAGFKVTAIEADAANILPNTYYDRTIKKGIVFKVNNETDPTYTDYSRSMAKDRIVTIYYAVEDYIYEAPEDIYEEPEETQAPIQTSKPVEETQKPTATSVAEKTPAPTQASNNSTSSSEWKQFLKDYEAWVDDYIRIYEKYTSNPTDLTIMVDYFEQLEKMVEWSEKADTIQGDLSVSDLTEYMKTITRIMTKLSQAGL